MAYISSGWLVECKIKIIDTKEEVLKDSECAFLITEWDEFKSLKPEDFKKLMKTPNVVDGRRIYPYEEFDSKLNFRAIGQLILEKNKKNRK